MEDFTNKELNVADLPKLEEQTFEKLHPNYLTIVIIFRVLVTVILAVALAIGSFQGLEEVLWLGLGIVLFGVVFVSFGYFGFFKKGFALREKDVSYRKGLLFHSITVVPLNRIQHSELVRGPFDRLFGLASVKIYTAGGSTSDITIPGMEAQKAADIRDYLTEKIKEEDHVSA